MSGNATSQGPAVILRTDCPLQRYSRTLTWLTAGIGFYVVADDSNFSSASDGSNTLRPRQG
jgi:hypothetical protein